MSGQISTFDEFWPFYVSQHLNPTNRVLHAVGAIAAVAMGVSAVIGRAPLAAVAGVVAAYALAWIGHFVYEKNRPATFTYPLLSLRADFRMLRLIMSGQMDTEILMLTKKLKVLRGD